MSPVIGIVEATDGYERWMADHLPVVVEPDLALKHAAMAASPFVLLRGTFYRWMELWPALCPDLATAPTVLCVGDLHIENFGTWRDAEGRLVWGVNDFDEAHPLPYTVDLVRLAASVRLATEGEAIEVGPRAACEAILEGYRHGLERGGRPIVLEEHDGWLRAVATGRLRDPSRFWPAMRALQPPATLPPGAVQAIERDLPALDGPYELRHRTAGVGSLGRPRIVALGSLHGAPVAREAKAWLPSAVTFVDPDGAGAARATYGARLLLGSVRCPDPMLRIGTRWIVRRLAPDCSRIELVDLPDKLDEEHLLWTMGWEVANLHLATPRAVAAVLEDLTRRPKGWLRDASGRMARATVTDFKAWRRHWRRQRDR